MYSIDYKQKYLKYKQKYLGLKMGMHGGADPAAAVAAVTLIDIIVRNNPKNTILVCINAGLTSYSLEQLVPLIVGHLEIENKIEIVMQGAFKTLIHDESAIDLYNMASNARYNENIEITYKPKTTMSVLEKQTDLVSAYEKLFTLISQHRDQISFSCSTVPRDQRQIHYKLDEAKKLYGDDPVPGKSPAANPIVSNLLLPLISRSLKAFNITEEEAIEITKYKETFLADVTSILSICFGFKEDKGLFKFNKEIKTQYRNVQLPCSINAWSLLPDESELSFMVSNFDNKEKIWSAVIQDYNNMIAAEHKFEEIIVLQDPGANDFDDIIVKTMASDLFNKHTFIDTVFYQGGDLDDGKNEKYQALIDEPFLVKKLTEIRAAQ